MKARESILSQGSESPILNAWTARLGASLQNLTGVKPSVHWTGSADGSDDQAMLWLEFATTASIRIHVGASESSWRGLAGRVLSANPSIEAYLDARQIYVNLLEQSSEQKGIISAHVPPDVQFELIELNYPGQQPIELLLGVRDDHSPKHGSAFGVLSDVEMPITIRFGTSRMYLQDLAGLDMGSTIEFDSGRDDIVEIFINGRLVAKGDAVVVQGRYGVRITEVISREERLNTSHTASNSSNTTQHIQKETR